uniref:BAH domain-containing protein n=1 Tax=Parascaris equorum TaxID=6256 RepID=A0A914RZU4_PAREQ
MRGTREHSEKQRPERCFVSIICSLCHPTSDPSKNKRGKAYKGRRDSEYKCFEAHDGVLYRPGDHVFIEVSQCEPYFIGTISNFKMVRYFVV